MGENVKYFRTRYIQSLETLLLFSKTYQTERESWEVGCLAKKGKEKGEKRESCLSADGDLEFRIGLF